MVKLDVFKICLFNNLHKINLISQNNKTKYIHNSHYKLIVDFVLLTQTQTIFSKRELADYNLNNFLPYTSI